MSLPEPPEIQGDNISTTVGEGAQNVAAGKNIVQIIIDKLNLPPWLAYSFVAGILVIAGGMSWFTWQAGRGGIPVAMAPTPSPTLTPIPTATPSPTLTPIPTATPSPTLTPIPTTSPTVTPTPLRFMPEQPDEVLIVIATFDRGEGVADSRPHAEIQRAIRKEAKALDFTHLRIEVEPTTLQAEDRTGADELGKRYNASLVIWGGESTVRITVNFLNRKEPKFEASEVEITETDHTFLDTAVESDPYKQFMTTELPSQLTFLTLFAVGQSYYNLQQYEQAATTIEHAVEKVTTQVPMAGLADAYVLLGKLVV